ncbi:hypothetical protein BC829DRAFT_416438 [Chytridium lagenaria]|nr:hypothetical protein BC829DRAFT_416438 [Chytridium lagenaria]
MDLESKERAQRFHIGAQPNNTVGATERNLDRRIPTICRWILMVDACPDDSSHQNKWYLESDLPKLIVDDYWQELHARNPVAHMKRQAFLKRKMRRPKGKEPALIAPRPPTRILVEDDELPLAASFNIIPHSGPSRRPKPAEYVTEADNHGFRFNSDDDSDS